MSQYLPILATILTPIVIFLVAKFVKKSWDFGCFNFQISLKGYKALEERTKQLQAENEELKMNTKVLEVAQKVHKELCDDCEKK